MCSTLHHILLGQSHQVGLDAVGMWHEWGWWQMQKELLIGNPKHKKPLRRPGRIILN